ncbi:hypothetical protein SeMB42_g01759 [Synchytrium endobioticum]|uniref:Potassium channel tetramerisation-type BTB domain-containing protein n=1 Tax=Synchytrium endobioticum TaxID=286115 RepID=A0A507DLY8_9FUNG|nr:hypothetical protein SeLEV6574_g02192 [Synchytrium endobioticum]TPX51910.1 hypothetical protein SeMB42_g01759 [Synchytrium endobioticum]
MTSGSSRPARRTYQPRTTSSDVVYLILRGGVRYKVPATTLSLLPESILNTIFPSGLVGFLQLIRNTAAYPAHLHQYRPAANNSHHHSSKHHARQTSHVHARGPTETETELEESEFDDNEYDNEDDHLESMHPDQFTYIDLDPKLFGFFIGFIKAVESGGSYHHGRAITRDSSSPTTSNQSASISAKYVAAGAAAYALLFASVAPTTPSSAVISQTSTTTDDALQQALTSNGDRREQLTSAVTLSVVSGSPPRVAASSEGLRGYLAYINPLSHLATIKSYFRGSSNTVVTRSSNQRYNATASLPVSVSSAKPAQNDISSPQASSPPLISRTLSLSSPSMHLRPSIGDFPTLLVLREDLEYYCLPPHLPDADVCPQRQPLNHSSRRWDFITRRNNSSITVNQLAPPLPPKSKDPIILSFETGGPVLQTLRQNVGMSLALYARKIGHRYASPSIIANPAFGSKIDVIKPTPSVDDMPSTIVGVEAQHRQLLSSLTKFTHIVDHSGSIEAEATEWQFREIDERESRVVSVALLPYKELNDLQVQIILEQLGGTNTGGSSGSPQKPETQDSGVDLITQVQPLDGNAEESTVSLSVAMIHKRPIRRCWWEPTVVKIPTPDFCDDSDDGDLSTNPSHHLRDNSYHSNSSSSNGSYPLPMPRNHLQLDTKLKSKNRGATTYLQRDMINSRVLDGGGQPVGFGEVEVKCWVRRTWTVEFMRI